MTASLGVVALITVGTVTGVATSGTNTPSPRTPAGPPAASQPPAQPTTSPPETAAPAPAPAPAPSPVTYTGVGSNVLRISKGTEPMAVTISHVGSSNFAVWSLDSSGQNIDLLVNTIGNYSGTRLIDAMEGEQTAALKIEADGSWNVTLKPLALVPVWDGTGTWTGKGDNLVAIQSGAFAGLDSVQITNSGESNFAVWAYGETKELLVNEIGNYSGELLMPARTVLLEIVSDGTWTLHKV